MRLLWEQTSCFLTTSDHQNTVDVLSYYEGELGAFIRKAKHRVPLGVFKTKTLGFILILEEIYHVFLTAMHTKPTGKESVICREILSKSPPKSDFILFIFLFFLRNRLRG